MQQETVRKHSLSPMYHLVYPSMVCRVYPYGRPVATLRLPAQPRSRATLLSSLQLVPLALQKSLIDPSRQHRARKAPDLDVNKIQVRGPSEAPSRVRILAPSD